MSDIWSNFFRDVLSLGMKQVDPKLLFSRPKVRKILDTTKWHWAGWCGAILGALKRYGAIIFTTEWLMARKGHAANQVGRRSEAKPNAGSGDNTSGPLVGPVIFYPCLMVLLTAGFWHRSCHEDGRA